MKYIKTYEKIKVGPEIGDYVCCHIKETSHPEEQVFTDNFLNNNVGILINIHYRKNERYEVEFENKFEHRSPFNELCGTFLSVNSNVALFYDDEIDFYSRKKQDVETYLSAKKYNL